MLSDSVTTLYKYYPPTEYSLAVLRDGGYWCASPRSFNDPFDCALTLAEDGLAESVEHAVERLRHQPSIDPNDLPPGSETPTPADTEAFVLFRSRLLTLFADVGLLCLTEVPDSLLMWAHYADSHRGFCIGLLRSPTNVLGKAAYPVAYSHDFPRLTAADFDPSAHPHSADVLWLTKSSCWSYEREWRLLSSRGNERRALDSQLLCLIFGLRMADDYRRAVLAALAPHNSSVTLLQATAASSRFAIELHPVQA